MFALTDAIKNVRLAAIVAAVDGGALPGEVWLYASPRPATGAVTAAALQCVIALSRPCATVAAGVLTLVPAEGERSAADTLAWGRIVDGAGNPVADFDVSGPGGTGDLKLDSLTGAIGSVVKITSGVLSE